MNATELRTLETIADYLARGGQYRDTARVLACGDSRTRSSQFFVEADRLLASYGLSV